MGSHVKRSTQTRAPILINKMIFLLSFGKKASTISNTIPNKTRVNSRNSGFIQVIEVVKVK
jgi:hypothetical protein